MFAAPQVAAVVIAQLLAPKLFAELHHAAVADALAEQLGGMFFLIVRHGLAFRAPLVEVAGLAEMRRQARPPAGRRVLATGVIVVERARHNIYLISALPSSIE